jgi:hypothetical protein
MICSIKIYFSVSSRVFNTTNGITNSGRIRSRDSSRENSLTRTLINPRQTPTLLTANRAYNRQDYRSNSRESLSRSNSKQRSMSHERDLLTAVVSGLRGRSSSFDRANPTKRHVSRSPSVRSPSVRSIGSGSHSSRNQFNPTEYVKSKNRKIEEIELKKQRIIHKNLSNGQPNRRSKLPYNHIAQFELFQIFLTFRWIHRQNANTIRFVDD